jgi:hypothetical protein
VIPGSKRRCASRERVGWLCRLRTGLPPGLLLDAATARAEIPLRVAIARSCCSRVQTVSVESRRYVPDATAHIRCRLWNSHGAGATAAAAEPATANATAEPTASYAATDTRRRLGTFTGGGGGGCAGRVTNSDEVDLIINHQVIDWRPLKRQASVGLRFPRNVLREVVHDRPRAPTVNCVQRRVKEVAHLLVAARVVVDALRRCELRRQQCVQPLHEPDTHALRHSAIRHPRAAHRRRARATVRRR